MLYDSALEECLKKLDTNNPITAVCPSPGKADILREILIDSGIARNITVTTISNFITTNILSENEEKISSKSRLLMEFWTLWKIKVSENYSEFRHCYDLFTDIRSYSISFDIFDEIKEFITEAEYQGLALFWNYLETSSVVDEQKSYHLIDESKLSDNLLFWGFDHLNANQLDLIKIAANHVDVFIPINSKVMSGCSHFDWPTWLTTELKINEDDSSALIETNSITIPEGRITKYLKSLSEKGDRKSVV